MAKLYVTYDQVHQLMGRLAKALEPFQPDVIVAIASGGLIPARMLRTFTGLPIVCVRLRRYTADNTAHDDVQPQVCQWVDAHSSLEGKRVVVVDEVYDSGVTLQFCLDKLRAHKPAALAALVLHAKDRPRDKSLPPDVQLICAPTPNVWIVYPWEVCDIVEHNKQAPPESYTYFL